MVVGGCMVWRKVELNVTCVHLCVCVYVRCGSVCEAWTKSTVANSRWSFLFPLEGGWGGGVCGGPNDPHFSSVCVCVCM